MLGWQRAKERLEKKDEVFMKECDDEINGLLVFVSGPVHSPVLYHSIITI